MKIEHKKIFFAYLGIIPFLSLLNINTAFAIEVNYPPIFGLGIGNGTLPEFTKYFFNIGMAVAGILAVTVIAFGGIYYLISLGRGKFTNEGKQWIKAGVFGLLLLISSYLITYTINPDLVNFRLQKLFPVGFLGLPGDHTLPGPPFTTYEEIPLGTLTETLLSRQIHCYDFDNNGNPLEEEVKTDDGELIMGPTLLNNDRADCLLQLTKTGTRIAELIKKLSDEIVKLMELCRCEDKCATTYSADSPGACGAPVNGQCLTGTACKALPGGSNNCCPPGVKDKIEHGPIELEEEIPNLEWLTVYGHMDKIYVAIGQEVTEGSPIGEIGEVGTNTGKHIHFAVGYHTGSTNIYNAGTSFDIYSNISVLERIGGRVAGTFPTPLPSYATPEEINFIKSTLIPPVSLKHCSWQEEMGSFLHNANAYYAQDWKCKGSPQLTNTAIVYNMSGGTGVTSKVIAILANEGGVVIEHSKPHPNPPKPPQYRGLDEFRTQLTGAEIVNLVELPRKRIVDKKEVTIIDSNKWRNLKLIEKLMYFSEKPPLITKTVKKDINQLDSARTKIAGCYLIKSSVDLLGIIEETKKENKIVLRNSTFRDSITNKVIDSSKYCKGFDYANSNSYMKCQKICPETMEDLSCYKGCQSCNEKDFDSQAQCLERQTQCLKTCYNNHKCPTSIANANPQFTTFKKCMEGFNQKCEDICEQKYASTSGTKLKECQRKCASKCLLENEEICTVNFQQLKACSANYSDPDNLKNCANNSFLCKYGSDEYAGYPDCTKKQGPYSSPYLYKNPDNQKCKNPYQRYTSGVNIGQTCLDLYPETAKCPTVSLCPKCPCGIVDELIDSPTYPTPPTNPTPPTYPTPSTNLITNLIKKGCRLVGGKIFCPKIPPGCIIRNDKLICSCNDPDDDTSTPCPCLLDDGTITDKYCYNPPIPPQPPIPPIPPIPPQPPIPPPPIPPKPKEILREYQIVTGTCNEFTYIGDPLTFYCRTVWEQEEYISGKWLDSSKADEIPVGQTVDDAKKWAEELINNTDKFTGVVKKMIEYIREKIAKETGYCQCNSTCEQKNGKDGPICSSGCQYVAGLPSQDPSSPPSSPTCAVKPCSGNGCQKMINLLRGGSTENCPVVKDGIPFHYSKVYEAFRIFYKFVVVDARTDILKELSYSRKKMDQCSQQSVKLGKDVIQTFSCTNAYRGISALQERCYGIYDGQVKTPPEDKTDNWFCLKTLLK